MKFQIDLNDLREKNGAIGAFLCASEAQKVAALTAGFLILQRALPGVSAAGTARLLRLVADRLSPATPAAPASPDTTD